ncbi:hypothetical protein [Ferrigenium kumadai]|uniref:hypothetical protein n=1 Tax=Ferrigenium kumadai TaxID=1682490 RepID=UPI001BB45CFC|nr:hypothetical protein [Ferrigenium kumadai]
MRFFTDQFFSEAQKTRLLENTHLIEHPSVRLGDQGIQSRQQEPVFYMEWQQDHTDPAKVAVDEGLNGPAQVTDLSAVMVMLLVGVFGGLFVFDVLIG